MVLEWKKFLIWPAHEGVQITLEAKKLSSGSKPQYFMKFVPSPDFISIDGVKSAEKSRGFDSWISIAWLVKKCKNLHKRNKQDPDIMSFQLCELVFSK